MCLVKKQLTLFFPWCLILGTAVHPGCRGGGGGWLGSRIKVTWMLVRKLKVNTCNQCGCGSNLKVTLKKTILKQTSRHKHK